MADCMHGGERKSGDPPGPILPDARPMYGAGIGDGIRSGAARESGARLATPPPGLRPRSILR